MESVRLDKYLWAIRVFKTRSEAADACTGNKVKLNGVNAKASKPVKPGDRIEVRKHSTLFSYTVLKLSESRMGAQLVGDFALNTTPESEIEKLRAPRETIILQRDKGSGRPTKKDRRALESLLDALED